jgi:hypothetical protein
MKISEINCRAIEKKATANLKKKAKLTQKLANTAQEYVQNYAPQPQQHRQPILPVQRSNVNQATIQPGIVKQQNRINNLVKQIAVSSNHPQPATDDETALAFEKYCQLKKQTDKNYAERLRQQLAQAETVTRRG